MQHALECCGSDLGAAASMRHPGQRVQPCRERGHAGLQGARGETSGLRVPAGEDHAAELVDESELQGEGGGEDIKIDDQRARSLGEATRDHHGRGGAPRGTRRPPDGDEPALVTARLDALECDCRKCPLDRGPLLAHLTSQCREDIARIIADLEHGVDAEGLEGDAVIGAGGDRDDPASADV